MRSRAQLYALNLSNLGSFSASAGPKWASSTFSKDSRSVIVPLQSSMEAWDAGRLVSRDMLQF